MTDAQIQSISLIVMAILFVRAIANGDRYPWRSILYISGALWILIFDIGWVAFDAVTGR